MIEKPNEAEVKAIFRSRKKLKLSVFKSNESGFKNNLAEFGKSFHAEVHG